MRFLVITFLLSVCGCRLFDPRFNYPGDKFVQELAYCAASKQAENNFVYRMKSGNIELYLGQELPKVVDKRHGKILEIPLVQLHYGGQYIDNSLRYFIREDMTEKQIKTLLGQAHEKWGNPIPNMLLWHMADGRKLSILPSVLSMPIGMKSYNLLEKNDQFNRKVQMIPLSNEALHEP